MVFAQKKSNHMLAILMALSFYLQVIISILILMFPNLYHGNGLQLNYTIAIRHPIVALPIFFMSVFAGVLCTRIQKGDFNALQSKAHFFCNCYWSLGFQSLSKRAIFQTFWRLHCVTKSLFFWARDPKFWLQLHFFKPVKTAGSDFT